MKGVTLLLTLLTVVALAPPAAALPPLDPDVDPTRASVFPVDELPRTADPVDFPEANVDGTVVVSGPEITLASDVFFEYNEHALTARAREELAKLAERLRSSNSELSVVGHTDARGSDAGNLVLSRLRAEAVRDHLLAMMPGRTITAIGRGEAEPVADNDSEDGRAANRRVVITAEA